MNIRSVSILAIVVLIQNGCSKSEMIPNEFLGNYFDTTGINYWACSIFSDQLIYENDFWSYKIKSSSENEIKLLIHKETGVKKVIKVSKTDTLYSLFDGKQKFICSKSSAGINIKPGNEFPMMEAGVAVIKGVVINDTSKNAHVKIEASKYFSTRESEVRTAEVDQSGRFEIAIPVLNSQSAVLIFGENRWRRIFITPGDSLTILINGQDGKPIHFMGTNSEVCYHIQSIHETLLIQLGEARSRRWDLEPLDYRMYMDSLASVQLNYLHTYTSENHCSDLFIAWGKSLIECTRVSDLGRYRFMSEKYGYGAAKRLDVNHQYYDFIESVDFNDTTLLLDWLFRIMVSELNNYYISILRKEVNSQARIHQDFYSILQDYSSRISEDDNHFIKSLSDSLEYYNTFSQELVKRLFSIADPFYDEYSFRIWKAQLDRRIDFFLNQEYSLMRDLLLMKVYDDMKRARMFDVLDYVYSRIDTLIQYPVFKDDIEMDYAAFLAKIESLQNIEFVANSSSESGEKLLLDIINSNRDTVVILDFWFTACGPCRTGFMKMKSIKNQLYDVPVKFVYLCYSSSEKDWESIIKEYEVKGDHYLLNGEQFAYFSNLLSISSAPRYVLIGKNGKIANDNFVQPQSYQQYMGALKKYLEN